jgi:hypothetical protein
MIYNFIKLVTVTAFLMLSMLSGDLLAMVSQSGQLGSRAGILKTGLSRTSWVGISNLELKKTLQSASKRSLSTVGASSAAPSLMSRIPTLNQPFMTAKSSYILVPGITDAYNSRKLLRGHVGNPFGGNISALLLGVQNIKDPSLAQALIKQGVDPKFLEAKRDSVKVAREAFKKVEEAKKAAQEAERNTAVMANREVEQKEAQELKNMVDTILLELLGGKDNRYWNKERSLAGSIDECLGAFEGKEHLVEKFPEIFFQNMPAGAQVPKVENVIQGLFNVRDVTSKWTGPLEIGAKLSDAYYFLPVEVQEAGKAALISGSSKRLADVPHPGTACPFKLEGKKVVRIKELPE